MRKQLLGSVALLALVAGGAANAADIPPPMYTKAPVADPWNWTGTYLGVNLGYSWGRSATDTTFSNSITGAVLSTSSNKFNLDGIIGGKDYLADDCSWGRRQTLCGQQVLGSHVFLV